MSTNNPRLAGVILHGLATHHGSLTCFKSLADFLSQHQVPTVLLIQCPTAADGAALVTTLSIPSTSSVKLSIIQPHLNLTLALSSAIHSLSLPPDNIAFISLQETSDVAGQNTVAAAAQAAKVNPQNTHQLDPGTYEPTQLVSLALFHIAAAIKQASSALCVGYAMKFSRQQALTAQGMLPFLPIDGVFFIPINLDAAPYEILQHLLHILDVFLHKPTDFFAKHCSLPETRVENGGDQREPEQPSAGAVPSFQPSLLSFLNRIGSIIIDPLSSLEPVLDRVKMAHALTAACTAARKMALPVRTPAWYLIEKSFTPEVLRAANAAGVSLPCVVKPVVACGVPESHQMAFILHPSGLQPDLDVPLPAVLQEYVDHKSTVWKVYVSGDSVFSVQRRSTPDLHPLKDILEAREEESELDIPECIEFHSLESLPVSLPWLRKLNLSVPVGAPSSEGQSDLSAAVSGAAWSAMMRPEFLNKLAHVLRRQLNLTFFGFDVVFDFAAGEAVVLDLNFFPSFKGIPGAPGAVRAAILQRYKEQQKRKPAAR